MSAADGVDGATRAALASQGKQILQATLVEAKAEEAADDKGKGLTAKVQRMKEDITRATVARAAAMHDREERAALAAAAAALKRGDAEHALKVVQARLAKVQRRVDLRGADSDDSDDGGGEGESQDASNGGGGAAEAAAPSSGPPLAVRTAAMSREEWVAASGGCLSIGGGGGEPALAPAPAGEEARPEDMAQLRAQLDAAGFMMSGEALAHAQGRAGRILAGLAGLRAAGLPAFCVWAFDEPWELMRVMWHRAEAILGTECVLEPTVAAYHLNHAAAASGGNRYIGTNFALPHRDYTYSDTYDAEGRPQLLTVWVPVSDVAVDNGCMYVVPREFDVNYDRDDVSQHMLVQHTGWLAGKSYLSFPLAGARPLAPAPAGTMMAWWGNVIHWGSQCHASASASPRASIACVFRRKDAPADPDTPPISLEQAERMTLQQRLDVVLASMDFFKHWSTPWDKANKDAGPTTCRG